MIEGLFVKVITHSFKKYQRMLETIIFWLNTGKTLNKNPYLSYCSHSIVIKSLDAQTKNTSS